MYKRVLFILMIGLSLVISGSSVKAKAKKAISLNSNDVIVLAMHGVPASDTPADKVGEYHKLHGMMESAPAHVVENIRFHYERLDSLVRHWPRTPENDPYYFGTKKIAIRMAERTGAKVLIAFNEFCAPDLPSAFSNAVAGGAKRVIVITAMLTPGGNHAEIDIPAAIEEAQAAHPGVEFKYAWPFEIDAIAGVLIDQIGSFVD